MDDLYRVHLRHRRFVSIHHHILECSRHITSHELGSRRYIHYGVLFLYTRRTLYSSYYREVVGIMKPLSKQDFLYTFIGAVVTFIFVFSYFIFDEGFPVDKAFFYTVSLLIIQFLGLGIIRYTILKERK